MPLRAGLVAVFAATGLGIALAFVWLRTTLPSDGAVASFYGNTSVDGLSVAPAQGAISGGLAAGDVVTALAGRPLMAWADGALAGTAAAPGWRVGDDVSYTVRRLDQLATVAVTLAPFPTVPVLVENWSTLAFVLASVALGLFVLARRPRDEAAAAFATASIGLAASTIPWLFGISPLDLVYGVPLWLFMAATLVWYLFLWAGAMHFALVFPNRSPLVVRHRWLIRAAYGLPLAIGVGGILVARALVPTSLGWMAAWGLVQAPIVLGSIAVTTLALIASYRRRSSVAREQIRWVVIGSVAAGVSSAALWFGPEFVIGRPLLPWNAIGLSGLPVPLAFGAAILRRRLFDIDVVVNRSLVYGGLSAGILGVYVLTVTVLGGIVGERVGVATSILATGIVAVLAQPMRDGLQRFVNRLMYGDRDEPYHALRRLGQRLEESVASDAVLAAIVDTVAQALRLPYVAVVLKTENGEDRVAAAVGRSVGREEAIPLADSGEALGSLLVAPRSATEPFSAADRRLLGDLARQAGPPVRAVRLTAELQRSRERLVAAREEERRRLRRDLHDGLGPALAGIALKLDAARNVVHSNGSGEADSAALDALLRDVRRQAADVIADLGQVVEGLRPPALDELGLAVAVREAIARFEQADGAGRLAIDLDVTGVSGPLPAAVEVAAYRIILEAVTNVARHAGATRCFVEIRLGKSLRIEVIDNGGGLPAKHRSGVGLHSMRDRADELGGSLTITSGPNGTRVLAELPLFGPTSSTDAPTPVTGQATGGPAEPGHAPDPPGPEQGVGGAAAGASAG